MPGMDVWRPGDPVETTVAWAAAIERDDGPTSLLLSRQSMPFVTRSDAQIADIGRGAYILRDAKKARCAIIATGSELGLAMAACDLLARDGIAVRVVSMPSTTVFDRQDVTYKRQVLPETLPRIAVEAGVTDFWWKYRCDAVVGLDQYGESAPAGVLLKHFGLTADNVADTVRAVLAKRF
jgi:transketolase